MARSLTVIAATTLVAAAAALAHTAVALSTADVAVPVHGRSGFYVFGTAVATLAWASAIVLTRSLSIAAAGGILTGGAAANLASLALWNGIPNPLTLGDLAFNVADVAVAVGLTLVLLTTAHFAARNRARLREPVPLRSG
jgi:hypothetical protein